MQFPAIKFAIDSMLPEIREHVVRFTVSYGHMMDLEIFDYCRELYPDLKLPITCSREIFKYRHNTSMLQYYHLRNELPEFDMHYFVELVRTQKFKYIKKYIQLFDFEFLTYDENIYAIINLPSKALRYVLDAGIFHGLSYLDVMNEIYDHVVGLTHERRHKIAILTEHFMTRGF